MKLALYLPNFRDKVTVKELEDLTGLAEELDFDSVWTLDRIVVPEASDRAELQYPFGMMDEFPTAAAGDLAGRVVPGHDADPLARREDAEGADRHEHHRHPVPRARRARRRARHLDHLSGGRLNVGVGAGWMPEEFAAASAPHLFPRRHTHVRETIEIMQGIWTNDLFEYHGEFADFDRCGFGAQAPPEARTRRSTSAASRTRSARQPHREVRPVGLDRHPGLARRAQQWRGAIQRELEELGSARRSTTSRSCSMIWFVITDEETDQTPAGKGTNLLAGTAAQITDILKRYKEAGLTMPLLWPPFRTCRCPRRSTTSSA